MFDELHHLILVSQHGTITAAARAAHLTQPSLSASIRRLEDAMSARLLNRHARGVSLTASGRALLPRAHAALAAVEDGRRAVAEVEGLHAGDVCIGAGATACTFLLPSRIMVFKSHYPGVTIRLTQTWTPLVSEALAQGDIDLGVSEEPGTLSSDLWLEDPLVVVSASNRAGDAPITDEEPWVSFVRGSSLRALQDRLFPDGNVTMELRSIATVVGMVRAGLGLALLSKASVQDDLEAGRLTEVRSVRPPARRLYLIHRGIEHLPPAAAALRRLLLDGVP